MTDSNPFVGTWKLVSWEITQPDGTIHYLDGKEVVGYLIYTADGYMSAQIMDPDRQQSDPSFPLELDLVRSAKLQIMAAPMGPVKVHTREECEAMARIETRPDVHRRFMDYYISEVVD